MSVPFYRIHSWYAIHEQVPLYDTSLRPVAYLKKGSIISSDSFETYNSKNAYHKLIIYKHRIYSFIPIVNNNVTTLVSDQDISTTYFTVNNNTYYFTITYKTRLIIDKDLNNILICYPIYQIHSENKLSDNIIWKSDEIQLETGNQIQHLINFNIYDSNYTLMLATDCIGIFSAYYYSEDIGIFKLYENTLLQKSSFQVYVETFY